MLSLFSPLESLASYLSSLPYFPPSSLSSSTFPMKPPFSISWSYRLYLCSPLSVPSPPSLPPSSSSLSVQCVICHWTFSSWQNMFDPFHPNLIPPVHFVLCSNTGIMFNRANSVPLILEYLHLFELIEVNTWNNPVIRVTNVIYSFVFYVSIPLERKEEKRKRGGSRWEEKKYKTNERDVRDLVFNITALSWHKINQ